MRDIAHMQLTRCNIRDACLIRMTTLDSRSARLSLNSQSARLSLDSHASRSALAWLGLRSRSAHPHHAPALHVHGSSHDVHVRSACALVLGSHSARPPKLLGSSSACSLLARSVRTRLGSQSTRLAVGRCQGIATVASGPPANSNLLFIARLSSHSTRLALGRCLGLARVACGPHAT